LCINKVAICVYNIIVFKNDFGDTNMKKIIQSIEPVVIAASGVDAEVIAQANLSEQKDIQQLLGGEENEIEDSV